MAYHPYTPFHNNSGVTFFGANPSEPTYVSSSDFVYNSGTSSLSVPNLIIASNGYIGSAGDPDAISIAANGNTVFSQNVSVNGNFTVNGTTTTVNSTTVTVEDPIITLGSGAPTTDDNKDRGIAFNWYDGIAKTGFLGFDDSSGKFTFIPEAMIENEVVTSGVAGILVADLEGNADTATDADQLDGEHGSYYRNWGSLTGLPSPTIEVALTGDVSGVAQVTEALGNNISLSINTTILNNSIELGTDTTGDYVESVDVSGTGLSIDETSGEGSTPVITSNATPVSTTGTLVARDTDTGGFSAGDVVLTKLNVDNIQIDGNTISATNTNGNIIINPNGNGALQADSGGDARGTNAVDWQMVRASGTQVASGSYSVIGGGRENTASGFYSTVGGGRKNITDGCFSTVSGGYCNCAHNAKTTVSGGYCNKATGLEATVSGGNGNNASGDTSVISGGFANCAVSTSSVVGGGLDNSASGIYATISGGYFNVTCANRSTITGGSKNYAAARHSSINGGHYNIIQSPTNECCSRGATIGGGVGHNTSGGTVNGTTGDITGAVTCCNAGAFSAIGGGLRNCASETYSTVSGGCCNNASGCAAFIGAGFRNQAAGYGTVIAGGEDNVVWSSGFLELDTGFAATIAGGSSNYSCNWYTSIGGGASNCTTGAESTISGGYFNLATGMRSTIGGGDNNKACADNSTVGGGDRNQTSGCWSSILGGRSNCVVSESSSILGGYCNRITGSFSANSTLSGGYCNCISNGAWSVIAGGDCNCITGCSHATIGGGASNKILLDGVGGTIAGGCSNEVHNCQAAILGGQSNVASGDYSAIAGGCCNTVSGGYSSIAGGLSNNTSEDGSFIGGGNENVISAGSYASILGGDTNKICGANFLFYGSYSSILGGRCNTVTAQYASTMSGYNNSITGNYSIAGGRNNTLSGLYNFSAGAENDDDGNNFVQLLGSGLTATQGHTTYVENLIATGVVTANEFVGDLTGNADTATIAVDASGLTSAVTIQVSDQVSGSATFQDAGDTANIAVSLTDASITGQALFSGTVEGANDYLLIYDNGVGLRKISAQEFVGDLDIVTSFEVTDGTTTVQINQDEALTFSDGTGAEFVVTDVGGQPTVTVNSVDSEIVHDNLSGFVANEHINHSNVTFTAGSGISGGGDLTANRRFDIDISEYSATAVGAGDSFLMLDNDGSTEQRSTVDQLGTYMAGTNITNTAGVLSVPDSTIDGVVFEDGNFVDSNTVDFTVTAGTSVTAIVKDLSITEGKRSRTVDANVTSGKTADKDITLVNASSGNVTISLPENATSGRVITIKRKDGSTNNVIISRSGADSIDTDFTTVQLYHKNETMTFVSDGSNWWSI